MCLCLTSECICVCAWPVHDLCFFPLFAGPPRTEHICSSPQHWDARSRRPGEFAPICRVCVCAWLDQCMTSCAFFLSSQALHWAWSCNAPACSPPVRPVWRRLRRDRCPHASWTSPKAGPRPQHWGGRRSIGWVGVYVGAPSVVCACVCACLPDQRIPPPRPRPTQCMPHEDFPLPRFPIFKNIWA